MVNKCSVFECMKLSIEFMVIYSQVERHKACGESSERFLSRSFTLARDIIRINLVQQHYYQYKCTNYHSSTFILYPNESNLDVFKCVLCMIVCVCMCMCIEIVILFTLAYYACFLCACKFVCIVSLILIDQNFLSSLFQCF